MFEYIDFQYVTMKHLSNPFIHSKFDMVETLLERY